MTNRIKTDSEPPTVRYNALAYERKIERQLAEELDRQPITQRDVSQAPITQRAVPKQ